MRLGVPLLLLDVVVGAVVAGRPSQQGVPGEPAPRRKILDRPRVGRVHLDDRAGRELAQREKELDDQLAAPQGSVIEPDRDRRA